MTGKSEGRRSKAERRPKSEGRDPNFAQWSLGNHCTATFESRIPNFHSFRLFGIWVILPSDLHFRLLLSGFGFRPSFGLRPSAFGFSTLLILFFLLLTPLFADTNLVSPDEIPPLRPPRGELAPTYWERHGAWPIVFGGLGVVLVGAGAWLLLRPKPPVPIPPAVVARKALNPLVNQPENGIVLSRVSQVVRHYFSTAFGLPPGELTTTEFARELETREKVGAALSSAVNAFLRECDRRKFSPSPPPAPLGAAGLAARLIEQAEAKRVAAADAGMAQKT